MTRGPPVPEFNLAPLGSNGSPKVPIEFFFEGQIYNITLQSSLNLIDILTILSRVIPGLRDTPPLCIRLTPRGVMMYLDSSLMLFQNKGRIIIVQILWPTARFSSSAFDFHKSLTDAIQTQTNSMITVSIHGVRVSLYIRRSYEVIMQSMMCSEQSMFVVTGSPATGKVPKD